MPQLRNLSSYHHTDSLLIQFVINEFLMTMEEASQLAETLLQAGEKTRIKEILFKLSGSEQDYGKLFSWVVDCGVLTKLKHNAALLREGDPDNAEFASLHKITLKAWSDCQSALQNLETLTSQKALDSLSKLKPIIKKILPKFKDDENVIYFVLRHHKILNHNLGKAWTKRFFATLHPEGALKFLKARYEARGFSDLIPDITEKLQELSS